MPPGEAWLQQDDSTLVHPVRPHGMSISVYIQYLPKRSYRERYGFGNWFGQCRGKAVHHRSHQEWGFVESWAWIDNQYVPVMQGWTCFFTLHIFYMFLVKAFTNCHVSLARFVFQDLRLRWLAGVAGHRFYHTTQRRSCVNLTSGLSWGRCWFGSCDTLEQAQMLEQTT